MAADPGLDEIVSVARTVWLRDGQLGMDAVIAESGISRATLYRRVGNKDRLLGLVFASVILRTFERAESSTSGVGKVRVLAVLHKCLTAIVSNEGFRQFLRRDPRLALRIVATPDFAPQGTSILCVTRLLEEAMPCGDVHLVASVAQTATAIIRLAESFVYSDLLTGEDPDVDTGISMIGLLIPSNAIPESS